MECPGTVRKRRLPAARSHSPPPTTDSFNARWDHRFLGRKSRTHALEPPTCEKGVSDESRCGIVPIGAP